MMIVLALAALIIIAGCDSPEVQRSRGSGSGADVGNRGKVVQMHEGSKPYHDTPQLIGSGHAGAGSTKVSDQASRR
jgi:hypothetical protein